MIEKLKKIQKGKANFCQTYEQFVEKLKMTEIMQIELFDEDLKFNKPILD